MRHLILFPLYLIVLFPFGDCYVHSRGTMHISKQMPVSYMSKSHKELDDLFKDVEDVENLNDASSDIKNQIEQKLGELSPSDMEVRLNIMGFTPLTYIGFAVAFVLVFLNTVLGTGWASDLFDSNPSMTTTPVDFENPDSFIYLKQSVLNLQNRP